MGFLFRFQTNQQKCQQNENKSTETMPILLSDIGRDQHGPTSTPAVLSDPLKILHVDDEQQVPLLVDHASSSSSTVPIDIMSILKGALRRLLVLKF